MTRLPPSLRSLRLSLGLVLALPALSRAQAPAESGDAATVGVPKPAAELATGTTFYRGTIDAGGQSQAIAVTRTVKEEGGAWVVTDTATLPTGEAVDTTVVEKGSLVVRKRSVRQDPVTLEIVFEGGKATGSLTMGDEPRPIDAELGGELFADGSCTHVSLAALPLAEGYTTRFRNFDVRRQKPSLRQIQVLGVEEIAVAAGTFKAWKAEVSSAEGEPGATLLWIDTASRKVVKTSTQTPAMGGATITTELQP